MKLIRSVFAAGLAFLGATGAAHAGVSVHVGLALPGVYVAPAPVYYAPPPPAVYREAVYVRPAPVYYVDSYAYAQPVYVKTKVKVKRHKHWRHD